MPTPARRPSPPRRRKRSRWLRWIAAIVLLTIAAGYVQPLRSYRDARADVEAQRAELTEVAGENERLGQRLVEAGTDAFVEREARKLGLIRPGERLFIVTGIDEWRADRQTRAEAGLR